MTIKIIFMGTIDFSATVLAGLLTDGRYEVLAVCTQPDRKIGRKQILTSTPVKELALKYEIPVYQPEKLSRSEEMTEMMRLGAEGIVTAAFGQFLPSKLLDSVKFAVNVHGSLLPWGRGGAPIQRAIMAGHKEIGVTIIEMVKAMDAGRMLGQKSIPVLDNDNAGSMFEKLAIVGRDLLLEVLPNYLSGDLIPEVQDENQVVITPNIAPEEEIIDWTKSATEILNLVRGLAPAPGAYTLLNGQRFKIYDASVVEGKGAPGELVDKTKTSVKIGTGKGLLELKKVQPFGKTQMSVIDYLNGVGRELKVGDKFGK
ncbi:methionyl-tRNA formyltransferase [Lactovum miscens]|uniref:Methionyl-tRNA formyltransferase n=1 Tax=Lactovum miscens TaxID=190387 RepID=A0A841C0P0_9LACT|nr:methionyl-tRNA formyltransferase [Lactovum miscens]MBB5887466.1 methionyl-tRNA formyltransferase [Lactovum miscens]